MGVIENLKDAALFAQKIGQMELYKKLLDAEDEVREATREKRRLEDRLADLEQKLKVRNVMTFKAPVYYQEGDATAFCARCFEKDERAVHLVKNWAGAWCCNVCASKFFEHPEDDGPAFGIAPMSRG